ncbi:hypothetical protein BRADI_5g24520v3 [Brachypodium distachyon]|uniref:Inhibitor I9 domain-containing protein n=1 Tax=Brachypodium distachyon TaxID=15368 RepID=I1J2S9_BRADI|nr:hypothetical protein BRADI_5g24520v3 [Brachypodium distachyon]
MANHLFRLPALLLLLTLIASTTELGEREAHVEPLDAGGYRTYIVLLERPGGEDDMDDDALRAWHQSYLPSMTTALGQPRLKSSYRTDFTGFSARLTEEELKQVSAKPGFVRSFPNVICYLALPNRMRRRSFTPTPAGINPDILDSISKSLESIPIPTGKTTTEQR